MDTVINGLPGGHDHLSRKGASLGHVPLKCGTVPPSSGHGSLNLRASLRKSKDTLSVRNEGIGGNVGIGGSVCLMEMWASVVMRAS